MYKVEKNILELKTMSSIAGLNLLEHYGFLDKKVRYVLELRKFKRISRIELLENHWSFYKKDWIGAGIEDN